MRLARKTLPQKGATLARLKLDWAQIVGPQLAGLCQPQKLSPTRGGRKLTLRVIPAAAPIVAHQTELIRQRVSVAAGGDITKLHLEHGLLTTPKAKPLPPPRALTEEEQQTLNTAAGRIEDQKLRAAIVALGEAVLTADSPQEHTPDSVETDLPF